MTLIEMTASPPGVHNLGISPVNDLSLKESQSQNRDNETM